MGASLATSVSAGARAQRIWTGRIRPGRAVVARGSARRSRLLRRVGLGALAGVVVLAAPVPWRHVVSDDPPAMVWRLDGNLSVTGEVVDPAGRWSWLTVGRPPVVAEVVTELLRGDEPPGKDLRVGSGAHRPALNEPAAAAVGLRHAGEDIELGLRVEVADPTEPGLPGRAVLTHVDGVELVDRATWEDLAASRVAPVTFRLDDGVDRIAEGPALPFATIRAIDLAPSQVDASIYAWLPEVRPVRWFRSLTLGQSHGLLVALTTYADRAEPELGAGRHIAGTGGVRGDGTVTRIGGLAAKARAARNAGADVLVYPAVQAGELVGFDAGDMVLLPVTTVTDAIDGLRELDSLVPVGDQPAEVPADQDLGG
jgi:hypothetical protein